MNTLFATNITAMNTSAMNTSTAFAHSHAHD